MRFEPPSRTMQPDWHLRNRAHYQALKAGGAAFFATSSNGSPTPWSRSAARTSTVLIAPACGRTRTRTTHERNEPPTTDSSLRPPVPPPGGLRRDGGAVLDCAAPGRTVGEHVGLDMNHDLVTVGCERQRIAGFEQPLGHPRQRISAANGARRPSDERPTWDVGQELLGVRPSSAGVRTTAPLVRPGPLDGRARR